MTERDQPSTTEPGATRRDRGLPTDLDAILARIEQSAAALPQAPVVAEEAGRRLRTKLRFSAFPADPREEAGAASQGRTFSAFDFLGRDDDDFVSSSYRAMLGREPGRQALDTLLPALEQLRVDRWTVLGDLQHSPEAKVRNNRMTGVAGARVLGRLQRLPKVGRLFRALVLLLRAPRILRMLELRMSGIERRHRGTSEAMRVLGQEVEQHLDGLIEDLNALNEALDNLSAASAADASRTREEIVDLRETLGRLNTRTEAGVREVKAARLRLLEDTRALRDLVAETQGSGSAHAPEAVAAVVGKLDTDGLDNLYLNFENRFRGSQELIRGRIERYKPLVERCAPAKAGGPILDIGCGRGEWLSLLSANGFVGRGIDLNLSMVVTAREAGHDVLHGDAIAYLQSLPAGSLAGVSGFQIVEHLTFEQLIALLDAAREALMPGGIVLFETPNPECLTVGSYTFHYDPTHQRPLPPAFLDFLAEARGFAETRVIRFDSDCDLDAEPSRFEPTEINSWFQMPLDYALWARKADH